MNVEEATKILKISNSNIKNEAVQLLLSLADERPQDLSEDLITILLDYFKSEKDSINFKRILEIGLKTGNPIFKVIHSKCLFEGFCYPKDQNKGIEELLKLPEDKNSCFELGNLYSLLKSQKALYYYKKAAELGSLESLKKCGELFFNEGRCRESLNYFLEARGKGDQKSLFKIIECYIEMNDLKTAKKYLEEGEKFKGNHFVEGLSLLVKALENKEKFEDYYNQGGIYTFYTKMIFGILFFENKQYEKALELLNQARMYPKTKYYMVKVLFYLNQHEKARDMIKYYERKDPLFEFQINAYLNMKTDLQKSLNLYEKAYPKIQIQKTDNLESQFNKFLNELYLQTKDPLVLKTLVDFSSYVIEILIDFRKNQKINLSEPQKVTEDKPLEPEKTQITTRPKDIEMQEKKLSENVNKRLEPIKIEMDNNIPKNQEKNLIEPLRNEIKSLFSQDKRTTPIVNQNIQKKPIDPVQTENISIFPDRKRIQISEIDDYLTAIKELQEGNYQNAKNSFLKSKNKDRFYYLGKIEFILNNYSNAIEYFSQSQHILNTSEFLEYLGNPLSVNGTLLIRDKDYKELIENRRIIDEIEMKLRNDIRDNVSYETLETFSTKDLKAKFLKYYYFEILKHPLTLYENFVKIYPDANLIIGIYNEKEKQTTRAEHFFKQAIQNKNILFEYAKYLFNQKEFEKALNYFPKNLKESNFYIGCIYKDKNIDLAIEHLMNSDHYLAPLKLGKLFLSTGDLEKAEEYLLKSKLKDLTNEALGMLYIKKNQIEKALDYLQNSKTKNSKSILINIYIQNPKHFDLKKAEEIVKLIEDQNLKNFHMGMIYYKGNDFPNAKLHLEQIKRKDNEVLYILGKIYLSEDNIQMAIQNLTISSSMKNELASYELGMIYLKGEKIKKNELLAFKFFSKVNDSKLLNQIGIHLYKNEKDYRKAIEFLKESKEPESFFLLGEIYYFLGEKNLSMKYFTLSIDYCPKVYYYLGKLEKDNLQSIEYFKKGHNLGDLDCTLSLGLSYQEKDQVGLSYLLEAYQKGVIESCEYIGKHYSSVGDLKTAKIYFEKIQNNEYIYMKLGHIYSKEDIPKAIEYFEKSYSLGFDSSLINLYKIYKDVLNDELMAIYYLNIGIKKEMHNCYFFKALLLKGSISFYNSDEIEHLLLKAYEIDPNVDYAYELGNFYSSKKEFTKAIQYYEIGKRNGHVLSKIGLFRIFLKTKNLKQAFETIHNTKLLSIYIDQIKMSRPIFKNSEIYQKLVEMNLEKEFERYFDRKLKDEYKMKISITNVVHQQHKIILNSFNKFKKIMK